MAERVEEKSHYKSEHQCKLDKEDLSYIELVSFFFRSLYRRLVH